MRRSFAVNALVAAGLTTIAGQKTLGAQQPASYSYDFRASSNHDSDGMTGTVRVSGGRARIEDDGMRLARHRLELREAGEPPRAIGVNLLRQRLKADEIDLPLRVGARLHKKRPIRIRGRTGAEDRA